MSVAAINFQKAAESHHFPAIVRLTALQLVHTEQQYTKPGEWLKALPYYDLQHLIAMCNDLVDDPTDPITEAVIVLTMILTQAEGVLVEDATDMRKHVGALINFLAMESLARKGLIEIVHENISFGDDAGSLIVARAKDVDQRSATGEQE